MIPMKFIVFIVIVGYALSRFTLRPLNAFKSLNHPIHGSIFRGGATDGTTTTVLVMTSLGSSFLDKHKKFIVRRDQTIMDLKNEISLKFAGSPPVELIRLYLNDRILEDSESIDSLSPLPSINIQLDLACGTAVYDKTLHSVSQALNGYVATVVQQAFLGQKLRDFSSSVLLNASSMESPTYYEMFRKINDSVYAEHREEIQAALESEKNPELFSEDTKAWRRSPKPLSPLTQRLAKEFDLNARGVQAFIFYSFVLVVLAKFATTDSLSSLMMIMCIPAMWLSKVRQLRIASKILSYTILPYAAKHDFWLPFLSAPYQALARYSLSWLNRDAPPAEEEEQQEEDTEVTVAAPRLQPLRRNNRWMREDDEDSSSSIKDNSSSRVTEEYAEEETAVDDDAEEEKDDSDESNDDEDDPGKQEEDGDSTAVEEPRSLSADAPDMTDSDLQVEEEEVEEVGVDDSPEDYNDTDNDKEEEEEGEDISTIEGEDTIEDSPDAPTTTEDPEESFEDDDEPDEATDPTEEEEAEAEENSGDNDDDDVNDDDNNVDESESTEDQDDVTDELIEAEEDEDRE